MLSSNVLAALAGCARTSLLHLPCVE